jgi:hypothetical protein
MSSPDGSGGGAFGEAASPLPSFSENEATSILSAYPAPLETTNMTPEEQDESGTDSNNPYPAPLP